ncbi:MAG: nucleoside hydrolase [Verrucomicrobiae bacterium]|nr:nucleoside hydrolase [Verrucomicrobiae bacterium]
MSFLPAEPVRIIFDTDMGSDCDDVGALALLHHYVDQGEAELVACIFSSGKVPYGAGIIDAINRYYGRPDIPVGAYQGNDFGDPVDKMRAEAIANRTEQFGNEIIHNRDAEDMVHLLRRLLASNTDGPISYVTVGHTRGLYELLISGPDEISPLSGRALMEKHVDRWVALGALGANNPEGEYRKDWNFFFNGTALYTKRLLEEFPQPVFLVDGGTTVMTGKSLKYTPPGNIVRVCYTEWLDHVFQKTLDDQRPSWDLVAIYFAVSGTGDFLENNGQGHLEFDAEKGCRWWSGKGENDHFFISQTPGTGEAFAAYLNERIAAPPKFSR